MLLSILFFWLRGDTRMLAHGSLLTSALTYYLFLAGATGDCEKGCVCTGELPKKVLNCASVLTLTRLTGKTTQTSGLWKLYLGESGVDHIACSQLPPNSTLTVLDLRKTTYLQLTPAVCLDLKQCPRIGAAALLLDDGACPFLEE